MRQNLITVILALVLLLFCGQFAFHWIRPAEAQAQATNPSLAERQVVALERIANEMARMRRECNRW